MKPNEKLGWAISQIQTGCARLIEDNQRLAEELRQRTQLVIPDTKAGKLLRDALDSKVGWRDEARALLGLNIPIACDRCGNFFPSGGKRKKFCGECK